MSEVKRIEVVVPTQDADWNLISSHTEIMVLASDYDALLAERDALQQQVESLQNKWAQRPLSVADTAALEAENDALRADAERMEWFFGEGDKLPFMQNYLLGIREKWTVDQWRASIDAARLQTTPGDKA